MRLQSITQEQGHLGLYLLKTFPYSPARESNKVLPLQKLQKPLPKDTGTHQAVVQIPEVFPACSPCKV